jgi:hypothetical protein
MTALPATFASLGITDVRDSLSVVASTPAGCRRARNAPVASATLHFNGPPVGVFGKPQAELYHVIAIDTPNHQARIGADSLQYHLVVLSDGSIYQTRDLAMQAWHCANQQGNETSLAVHLPLGGLQDATDAQWRSTCALFDAIIMGYRLSGRSAIKAHCEWSATACPGPRLLPRLQAWRADVPHLLGFYRIRKDVAVANIREGPARSYPVALWGKAVLYPGDTVDSDSTTIGEMLGGDATWLHLRDGRGFVHRSLVEAL